MGLLYTMIVGILAGWLGNKLMGNDSSHLLKNLLLGIIGSFVGSFVASFLGISASGMIGNVLIGAVGAVIFTWLSDKLLH